MGDFSIKYQEHSAAVLDELNKTLSSIKTDSLEHLKNDILDAEKVYFVGVGRVLLSLQAITKRLAHRGISSHYVGEITEPAITD